MIANAKAELFFAGTGPKVYFARVGSDGPVKIGYTDGDPRRRLDELQTGCPWRLWLLGAMEAHGPRTEKEIHRQFAKLRMIGEWFAPDPILVEFVRRMAVSPISGDNGEPLPVLSEPISWSQPVKAFSFALAHYETKNHPDRATIELARGYSFTYNVALSEAADLVLRDRDDPMQISVDECRRLNEVAARIKDGRRQLTSHGPMEPK